MSSHSSAPDSEKAPTQSDESQTTESLGQLRDYELLEIVGRGGMGTVYKARHTRLERIMAVKVLPEEFTRNEQFIARFNREMVAIGRLQHPNIVQAHDAGEEHGRHYLAMEYVDGIDLGELSKRLGPFPVADACELIRQTAVGLQYAHRFGLVHRDIKPSNLLLTVHTHDESGIASSTPAPPETASDQTQIADKESAIVKILDLGLALIGGDEPSVRDELTSTGKVMGTLDYIAPEQVIDTHRVDIRADIYSLGCTLYRLLAGAAPFSGPEYTSAFQKMKAHHEEPVPVIGDKRGDIPDDLVAVLDRLLAKRPEDRYQTPAEVAAVLEPLAKGHQLVELLERGKVAQQSSETEYTLTKSPIFDPLTDTLAPTDAAAPPQPTTARRGSPDPVETADRRSPEVPAQLEESGDLRSQPVRGQRPAHSRCPVSDSDGQGRPSYSPARSRTGLIIAATVAVIIVGVLGWLYGLQVIRIAMGKGVLVIEADEQAIEVTIKQGQAILKDKQNDREYVLKEGDEYTVEVTETTSGLSFTTKAFSITRGDRKVLNVRRELAAVPKHTPDRSGSRETSDPAPAMPHRILTTSPTPADRAAAEWVLQQKGEIVNIGIDVPPDKTIRTITKLADLPREPFRLRNVIFAGVEDLDAATLDKRLATLPSLSELNVQRCRRVTNDVVPVLQKLPNLQSLRAPGSGISAPGLIRLLSSMPLWNLEVDAVQLTPELVTALGRTPSVISLKAHKPGDEQLRLTCALKQLKSLTVTGSSDLRHSTFARMADEMPQLQQIYLDNVRFDDADLAALARLPNLERLNVGRLPQFTDAGLAALATAAKLNFLHIRKSGVTAEGLADLLDAQPQCQVDWDGPDHRAVAEWVLSVGGKVQLAGSGGAWKTSRETSDSELSRVRLPVLLTGVDLAGNKTIQDTDLARLADCSTLRDLVLNDSNVTGACLEQLRRLKRLRVLNLGRLPVQDEQLAVLEELRQLQVLYLPGTKVTDAGLSHLTDLRDLTTVGVDGTRVTSDGLSLLKNLPKFVNLILDGANFDDRTVELLCEFPALRTLFLTNAKVTEAGLRRLAQRPLPWHRLNLAGTPMTDTLLAEFAVQRELVELHVTKTQVTPGAFDAFVQAHPVFGMTAATETSDAPDLRIARRVLAAGGLLTIVETVQPIRTPTSIKVVSFRMRQVRKLEDLPATPFRIKIIDCQSLSGAVKKKINNETLAELSGLEFVELLHVPGTSVTEALVDEIVLVPHLNTVNLSSIPLSATAIEKLAAGGFPAAKQSGLALLLHDAGLTDAAVQPLGKLTHLRNLDLGANTTLTDSDMAFLNQLPRLETLNIGFTKITGPAWSTIAKLPKLKQLYAYNMPVSAASLAHLRGHATLELLQLGSASEVSDEALTHIATLRSLRELQLYHCRKITSAGLAALAELPALETLVLNNTPITNPGLKHLARLKTLKHLDLTACDLTPAALDELQDALPWCRIAK